MRRAAVETVPGERFAALLAASLRTAGSQEAQLRAALDGLLGQFHPLAAWEGSLLPARVANYRPALLDGLLAALRQAGVVCLKAVLTPDNRSWTPGRLYRELQREHRAMGRG